MSELRYEFIMSQIKHIRDIKENEKTKISLVFYEGCQGPCIFKVCKNRNLLEVYQALMEVRHPNVAMIYDCIYEDGNTYVLEEYIMGKTLAEILEEKGTFSEKETTRIMVELCKGLDVLHHHSPQVIHNDIKTSNIMIKEDGSVKLFDFDISRIYKDGAYKNTKLMGTYEYAAPEHYGFGQSDPRTDIYSLGVTMHEMLTGTGLNHERTVTYQGSLKKIIQKCVEIDSKKRYASAALLKTALEKHFPFIIGTWKISVACIIGVILLIAGGLLISHYLKSDGDSQIVSEMPGNSSEEDLGIGDDKNTEDYFGTEELFGTEETFGTEESAGTEEQTGKDENVGTGGTTGSGEPAGTGGSMNTGTGGSANTGTGGSTNTGTGGSTNTGTGGSANTGTGGSTNTGTGGSTNTGTGGNTNTGAGGNTSTGGSGNTGSSGIGTNTNTGSGTNGGTTDTETSTPQKKMKTLYTLQGTMLAMETWIDEPVVWAEKISGNYYLKTSDGKEKLLEGAKAAKGAQLACNPYTNEMYLYLYHYDDYSLYSIDKELNVNLIETYNGTVNGYLPLVFGTDGGVSIDYGRKYVNEYIINGKRYGMEVKQGSTGMRCTFLELDSERKVVNEFPLSDYSVDRFTSSVEPYIYDSGDAVYFMVMGSKDYLCRFDGEKYEMVLCLDDYEGYLVTTYDYFCVTDTGFRCCNYHKKAIVEFAFE